MGHPGCVETSFCPGSQGGSVAWASSMSTAFAFQSPFELAFQETRQDAKKGDLQEQLPLLRAQRSQSLGNSVSAPCYLAHTAGCARMSTRLTPGCRT